VVKAITDDGTPQFGLVSYHANSVVVSLSGICWTGILCTGTNNGAGDIHLRLNGWLLTTLH